MPYQYTISQITFSDQTTLQLSDLTVIVGPNNSGKSRALKDLLTLTTSSNKNVKVVTGVVALPPQSASIFTGSYPIKPLITQQGGRRFRCLSPTLNTEETVEFAAPHLREWPKDFESMLLNQEEFNQHFSKHLIVALTTAQRLQMVSTGPSSAEVGHVASLMQALYYAGPEIEVTIRNIVKEAFPDIEIALDFSVPQKLEFKIGSNFAMLPPDPRKAHKLLADCETLDDQGDGLRSYVGIVVALLALQRSVFLIDEPEAFLHPPQAFKMGRFIASMAEAGRQIIVATHSSDVLQGMAFNNNKVQIIRMQRFGTINRIKILSGHEVRKLTLDPMLSASGVLDGVFYAGVVVTEADGDSRFFQAVSKKINPALDIHFINADNKQTVPKILKTYVSLGVRCVGIVDIDVLNNATEFTAQMTAIGIEKERMADLLKCRLEIEEELLSKPVVNRIKELLGMISGIKELAEKALMDSPEKHEAALTRLIRELGVCRDNAKPWRELKRQGCSILVSSQVAFQTIYDSCRVKGLIVNPCGELESCLREYAIETDTNKSGWIEVALQLVADLTPNLERQPWRMMKDVHGSLV